MRIVPSLCAMLAAALAFSHSSGGLARRLDAQVSVATQESKLEALVRESAETVAARARYSLGTIHPEGLLAFRRWMLAVTAWRQDAPDGAAAALAEGVLFDCLGRTIYRDQGLGHTVYLMTDFTFGREADRRFEKLALPNRLEYAASVLENAYETDPRLTESKFRAARIRALTSDDAAVDLEAIATLQDAPLLAYLAAVSRGAMAHGKGDTQAALRWYKRALELHSRSTAATAGVATLDSRSSVEFDALDPNDPYYSYPCRVLTPPVATELSRRLDAVRLP